MDVNQIAVSLAKAEDVPQCILIDKDRGFEVDEAVQQKASKEDRLLVAKIDAKVIGYLRFGSFWDEEIAYIQMIRVDQAYRRKGVGRKLLEALEGILRKQKIACLLSSTQE